MSRIRLLARSVPVLAAAVAAMSAGVSAAQAPAAKPPPGAAADVPPISRRFSPADFEPPPPTTPRSLKAAAMFDLTGNWVSIVNEDWLWRMVTPPRGDYASVPLSKAGMQASDNWTPAQDGSCKAYGVAGLMRMPTRLKISWEGENTLKIETDAGMQTRRLMFAPPPADTPRTLQGYSLASWDPLVVQPPQNPLLLAAMGGAGGPAKPSGTLKVVTTHHTGGWLRKNGALYSENASVVEYYDRWPGTDGAEWMSVTTIVTDPANLKGPYYTNSHFRKEPDGSKWRPKPCKP